MNTERTKILVPGATGALGRCIVSALRARGYDVRALVRNTARAEAAGLRDVEIFVGDATRPESLRGCCDGIDAVVSALGAPVGMERTRGGATFESVDYNGNVALLNEAIGAGTRKFVYVAAQCEGLSPDLEYVRRHEDTARRIASSGIAHTIVRPTGFFSAYATIIPIVRRGFSAIIGDGTARTNPIHHADLAEVCADAVAATAESIAVGGPETLTRREVTELAFAAIGKRPRIMRMPPWAFAAITAPVRLFDRRLSDMLRFYAAVSVTDTLAPAVGTRRLGEYFREVAGKNSE